ncbi:MAG: hypothetical protein K0Q83_1421 [Deltaproteobacteria bacterium]|nr:hypothetical protein [Deltaproteobacteria bacterium]
MINGQFIGISEVDTAVEGAFHNSLGYIRVAGQFTSRQAELADFVIERAVILVHFADHEGRHVVHKELV